MDQVQLASVTSTSTKARDALMLGTASSKVLPSGVRWTWGSVLQQRSHIWQRFEEAPETPL
jgi:hypothetical protein